MGTAFGERGLVEHTIYLISELLWAANVISQLVHHPSTDLRYLFYKCKWDVNVLVSREQATLMPLANGSCAMRDNLTCIINISKG